MNGLIKAKKLFSAYEVKNLHYMLEYNFGDRFIVAAYKNPLQSEEITLEVSNYIDKLPSKRFSADIEHMDLRNTTDFLLNQPHGNQKAIKDSYDWLLKGRTPNLYRFNIGYHLHRWDTNEYFLINGDCYYNWAPDKARLGVDRIQPHKRKEFIFPNDWWSWTIDTLKQWSLEQAFTF